MWIQESVNRVFDRQDVLCIENIHNLTAAHRRHADAERILQSRLQVDGAEADVAVRFDESIGYDTLVIQRQRKETDAELLCDRLEERIGESFDSEHLTASHGCRQNRGNRLLAVACEEQALSDMRPSTPGRHEGGRGASQRASAVGTSRQEGGMPLLIPPHELRETSRQQCLLLR